MKKSEIQRTFRLFDGLALNSMGVNHRSPDIAVSQQLLNRTNIIIGLQQMAGKTLPEGVGGSPFSKLSLIDRPFYRFLDMGFMQMISPVFPCLFLFCQLFGGKKPLPDKLPKYLCFLNIAQIVFVEVKVLASLRSL